MPETTPRLFSYVVRYDVGFAPNPFHGWCSLATCKPGIREGARLGDWIVGTGSKEARRDGHLVYAMQVEEILTFQQYWEDPRFTPKRPSMHGSVKKAVGDNIYHHDAQGNWTQEDSRHTREDMSVNPDHLAKDTNTDAVLLSQHFSYYGGAGPAVPTPLLDGFGLVHSGQGYRKKFSTAQVVTTVQWLNTLNNGYQSEPANMRSLISKRSL